MPEQKKGPSLAAAMLAALLLAVPYPCAIAAVEAWQPANGGQLAFDVYDGDKPAGQLVIHFSRPNPETLVVQRRGEITVSRLLMKAKLVQSSEERRVHNRLTAFSSTTQFKSPVKDADATLTLTRDAKGTLSGRSKEAAVLLPAEAMPSSFWRGDELRDGTYFDTSSGKPLSFKVAALASSEKASQKASIAGCQGREVGISDGEKKSRALLWVEPSGHICTMRLYTDLGPLDYVPATASQTQKP